MSGDAPYGYFPGTNRPRKAPAKDPGKLGTCKYCGEEGLVWEQVNGAWQLQTVGGKRHSCPPGTKR